MDECVGDHRSALFEKLIAVEPKKGLEGIGLVGVENTFLVTEHGGEKLTPGSDEITIIS